MNDESWILLMNDEWQKINDKLRVVNHWQWLNNFGFCKMNDELWLISNNWWLMNGD